MKALNSTQSAFTIGAIAWAAFSLLALAGMIAVSPVRGFDIYDIEGGLWALSVQPLLVVGGQVLLAWAGAALVVMVLGFNETLPVEFNNVTARIAASFGLISAGLFLFTGLVGGFSSYELRYLLTTRSVEYVRDAYLPLAILTNRAHIAAIALAGAWFLLSNLLGLQSRAMPAAISYLGLAAGGVALLGFFLPGGGFGLLSSILMAAWGLLVGAYSLRAPRDMREKEVNTQ